MMNNENAPLPSRRTCGVIEAIEPNQGVWLSPLTKDSREQVWLAMAEIDPATKSRVKVGAWIEFELLVASAAPIAIRGRVI